LSSKNNPTKELANSFLMELARNMRLPQTQAMARILGLFFGRATNRMAQVCMEFDRQIMLHGPSGGSEWLLQHFVKSFSASGKEIIPQSGPLIIASNHPAAYDSLVIIASLNRPDLKVIIGDSPPYHFLPHLCQHAIFSPEINDKIGRMLTIRQAIQHLREGGALLIFPHGILEPDPDLFPNPEEEFSRWSHSLELFMRGAPQSSILITIASGVIARSAMNSPLTWFSKTPEGRQSLAYYYQFIRQMIQKNETFGLTPHVTFGELIKGVYGNNLTEAVEQAALRTLNLHRQSRT